MKKSLLFLSVLLSYTVLFFSCSEETPSGPSGNGGTTGSDEVTMSEQGEVKKVEIASSGFWYAETDDKWLQLSSMGGYSGGIVDVIAAYNSNTESRTGEIRIYASNDSKGMPTRSDGDVPSQVIKVEQPGNASADRPAFTEFYFENGRLFCTIYGGAEGGSFYDYEGSDMSVYDPNNMTSLLLGIKARETKTREIYVTVDDKEEPKGIILVGEERTANTLVIRQGESFRAYNDLGNEGSSDIHFSNGSKIYYGGGLVFFRVFAGMVQEPEMTNDFRCYDVETGVETVLPNVPGTGGAGCIWNDKILVFSEKEFYWLNGNEWEKIYQAEEKVVGVQVEGNTLYAVSPNSVAKYNLSINNGQVSISLAESKQATVDSEVEYTTDDSGQLWIFSENGVLSWLEGTTIQSLNLKDRFDDDMTFAGADGGYAYVISKKSIYKISKSGEMEMLRMVLSDDYNGKYENINGTIYSFGGTFFGQDMNYHASKKFKSFTPSKYIPMSLSIIPE